MSKRMTRFLTLVIVLTIAAAVFLGKHSAGASTFQRGLAPISSRNAAVTAATAEVLKETSEIRELSVLKPVKSGAQSRVEIEHMLIKNLNEQITAGQMHATEVSLRKLGLAPSGFEYRTFIIKLLTEQVAGYYDPKVQQFHLADWLDLDAQKPVMAHELTHALQDQHFNLRRFEKWPHGDADAELAAHALIEGDATLAMKVYMVNNPLVALAFSRSLLSGVATEQFNQAPRAMRESLIFPYLNGLEWATQLYKRGGWTMVSNAYTRLPLSTEQILHPEKYFNYERPVKIVLPDLTSLLHAPVSSQEALRAQQSAGRPVVVRPGILKQRPIPNRLPSTNARLPTSSWRRIDSDVNGEWSYYLILDQFLNTPAESRRAAAGWAGDRYSLYEGPNGQVCLAQVAVWDTENDAREFFEAYVKRTELRYPDARQSDLTDAQTQNRNSKLETRNSYSWTTSEGSVVMELRGLRVVILEGLPANIDSNALTRALWQ